MIKWNDQQLQDAVINSYSYRQVLLRLSLNSNGSGGYKAIKRRIQELKLDISHFCGNKWRSAPNIITYDKMPIDEVLQKCPTTKIIKKRLLNDGLVKNICYICGQSPVWNNLPLVLQLDHIDGNTTNNNLENLRLICPNCHTQTTTYGSKKLKLKSETCKIIQVGYKKNKDARSKYRKVVRPSKEELLQLITHSPMIKIAQTYGVSDNTIRKWIKFYGITLPNMRGYWQKQNREEFKIQRQ